jgi:putative transposase
MSQTRSPSTQRVYGLARVCRLWEVPRSTVYLAKGRAARPVGPRRRGPTPRWSDAALLEKIRTVLAAAPFLEKGHRKVWARLRWQAVRTSKARVLRLMREAHLLAPTRVGHAHGPQAHDGTITTNQPDQMWGMDATSCLTRRGRPWSSWSSITAPPSVSGCTPLSRGPTSRRSSRCGRGPRLFGGYEAGIARGLQAQHDHGSQYMSHYFQAELRFLGITSSPAFVREPEGNGVAEPFIRTLKEQLLWVRSFDTVEALRQALVEFKDRYNQGWLSERHGHQTPVQVRGRLLERAA